MISLPVVDNDFKRHVAKAQDMISDLIESFVNVSDDFGIFRPMIKWSESRATEEGVGDRVIDLINIWRKMEGNERGSMAMRDYYLDILLVKIRYLSYLMVLWLRIDCFRYCIFI